MTVRVTEHLHKLFFTRRRFHCRVLSRSYHTVVVLAAPGKTVFFLHDIPAQPNPRTAVFESLPPLISRNDEFDISGGSITAGKESSVLVPKVEKAEKLVLSAERPGPEGRRLLAERISSQKKGMCSVLNGNSEFVNVVSDLLHQLTAAYKTGWKEFFAVLSSMAGMGPGATPATDDFICGIIAGFRSQGVIDQVTDLPVLSLARSTRKKTTLLSWNYIVMTALDYSCSWQNSVISGLSSNPDSTLFSGIHFGHTSADDYLFGLHFALELIRENSFPKMEELCLN